MGQFWVSPSALCGNSKDKHWEEHSTWREWLVQKVLRQRQTWGTGGSPGRGLRSVRWVMDKALATKRHVEGEDWLPPIVLSTPCAPHGTCAP